MGARSEALARQFETKAEEAAAVLDRLNDADWGRVTAAEGWTVGATAHHLAGAFEAVAGIASGLAAGRSPGGFTTGMLNEMNARHAQEHARCPRAETVALHRRNAKTAAAAIRALNDEQLAVRGTVFTDAPPMTVEQFLVGALLGHIDEHVGSIRRTIGR